MKEKIKTLLGNLLIALQPKRAKELSKKGMTISLNNSLSFKDNLIRHSLLKKAKKNKDFNSLSEFHRSFWVEKGGEFFSEKDSNALDDFFIPYCSSIFEELQGLLSKTATNFNTMVEIGTGHGDVINYLSTKFHQIDRFVGIDLNTEQTIINQNKYQENKKLEFTSIDGLNWVKKSGASGMIFFTSGGVLEYFTEEELKSLLNELRNLEEIIFIAIEPIGVHVDFTSNPRSQIYGPECSFSHNYASLFKEAGFSIWHQSKIPFNAEICYFNAIGAKKES